MTCSLITDANFVDPNSIDEATFSSETKNFEAQNIYNRQQRSRVWRSGGYYSVDSTNNKIVFDEDGGGNITATVTEDNYASQAAFAAAIKAALELAGAGTYTVEQDATSGKWKITAAGLTTLDIIWTDGDSAGMAGLMGYSTAADDTGSLVYTADSLRINSEEWLLWDMGLSSLPTGFVLLGDRNEPIKLSSGSVIKIQGNHTNNFITQIYSKTIVYDEDALFEFDATGLGNTYLRYWRVQIVDTANANGYIELGYAFLGSTIQPTRGNPAFPFNGSQSDRTDIVTAIGGQVYGNDRVRGDDFTIDWQKLTTDEKENFDLHFKNKGLTFPFIVYLDKDLAFSSRQSYFLRLVRYVDSPRYSLVSPNNWSVTMNVREAL